MNRFGIDEAALGAELARVLDELIARPSIYPPGDTGAIAAYAVDQLKAAGCNAQLAMRTPPFANAFATLGMGKPVVAFNSHADTIGVGKREAWRTDPLRGVVQAGRVHGLGASNCKGAIAVQLWLAAEIARRGGPKRGQVQFAFVADEESLGDDGSAYLRTSGLSRPDVLVLGAPTENQLIIAERGVMWLRIETFGKAAHAGMPHQGDSAVSRMVRLITRLERELGPKLAARVDGEMRSTLNVGRIHGGDNINVVPDACVVELDRRLVPGETVTAAQAEIEAILKAAGEPAGSVRTERMRGTDGFKGSPDSPAVTAFRETIQARLGRPARFLTAVGVFDGRFYANDGIEIVDFGPGAGSEGHAPNESVLIAELVDAALIQLEVVDRLLGLAR